MSNTPDHNQKTAQMERNLVMSLPKFLRSVAVRIGEPHMIFLGAGASVSSGIPSAEDCIRDWKKEIYYSENHDNVDMNDSNLSHVDEMNKIQRWLDRQNTYPKFGDPKEYSFYIQECYPNERSRREYFKMKIHGIYPNQGYNCLCRMYKVGFVHSVWTTNFDGLTARAAMQQSVNLIPYEVGIDSKERLSQPQYADVLLIVSLNGDFRYDPILNTKEELQELAITFFDALKMHLRERPLIVIGYSGRDDSVMDAFHKIYSTYSKGGIYWCGYSEEIPNNRIESLLCHARNCGSDAYYVPSCDFDILMNSLLTLTRR